MAYTKTPETSTYQTVPLSFDGTTQYRSGTLSVQRDCNVVNMYYERLSQTDKTQETYLKKRPGVRATAYNLTKSSSSDVLRGYYYDTASNKLYWAVNNKVYSVSPDTSSSIRTVATLATSSGQVGFTEFLKVSSSTKYVIFSDGTDLWIDDYVGLSCNKVTDVDLPTPHLPQPITLNGYVFLAKTNTGDIYNCVNDDPTSWVPGDFITTEMSGDYVVQLAVNRNYVVAFGSNSLEIFWDAANVSGSPLARNDSGYKDIGYITGLRQIGNVLYFVGQDRGRNLGVYFLDGFTLKEISDSIVARSIQTIANTDNIKASLNYDRYGYSISSDGHTFYVLVTPQTTWVYDLDEKFWYEWKNSAGNGLDIEASWSMLNGAQYLAIGGQTYISQMSPELYQDFGSNYSCSYTTERFNANSYNKKVLNRIVIAADAHLTTGTSNITLTWSDDDWKNTTGTRDFNVFKARPTGHTFGQFVTRSFRITYTDNYPLRLRGMELEINIGAN